LTETDIGRREWEDRKEDNIARIGIRSRYEEE
jgi:hypothetical protein